MKEKIRDRQKNSSYLEIRVKRVRVNGFQLYFEYYQSYRCWHLLIKHYLSLKWLG